MAGYKKSYRKKSYRKKRITPEKPFKYKVADTAEKAFNMAVGLKRLINVEIKEHETLNQATSVGNAGTIYDLTTVPQGIAYNERDGNSIKPLRLSGRISYKQHASATMTNLRIIIFRWKESYANPPTVSSGSFGFLEDNTSSNIPLVISKRNENSKFLGKTLYDKTFHMSTGGSRGGILDIDIKLDGHLNYETGDSSGTNYLDSSLWIIFVDDEGTNVSNAAFHMTLSFVDN